MTDQPPRSICAFLLQKKAIILFALLSAGALFHSARTVSAQDMIVPDLPTPEESEWEETETETQSGPLLETEAVYEIPPGITDGLKKNTPVGEAADMTMGECSAFLTKIYEANAAQKIWKEHGNVTATYRQFDEDAQLWKEYAVTYRDPVLYYSDDWTPGLEELRLLLYGENSCVEDYTSSLRFVCFLNASGTPYRKPESDPVTLEEDTKDELLLNILRTQETLYVITQMTETSILRLGLEEAPEDAFYSCLYLLDPGTLEVRAIRIELHGGDDTPGSVREMRHISYSYDHGMTPFIETGYEGLLRHMIPGAVWAPEHLREVTLTLDPDSGEEKVFSLTALKGDPVSYTLPDGYKLYEDEALTSPWVDDGNYASDLALWAAKTS